MKDEKVPLTKTTLRLPAPLLKMAKRYALETDQDLQDVVTEALAAYLTRKLPTITVDDSETNVNWLKSLRAKGGAR